MLQAEKSPSPSIFRTERVGDALYLYSQAGTLRLMPYTDRSIRVSYTCEKEFSRREKPGVIAAPRAAWSWEEDGDAVTLRTDRAAVRVCRQTGACTYLDEKGTVLLREARRCSRELTPFTTTILPRQGQTLERVRTADGEKTRVRDPQPVQTGTAYHTRLKLCFAPEEDVYGLGQHEEGYGSLRGCTVYGHQANRKNALPLLVSCLGYGLLLDTYSPYVFDDRDFDTYLYTEADPELDFYFLWGGDMDGVIRQYRSLTGKASMLPKWAFGYIQSKERYRSARELLEAVAEYRRRGIGLDCIVMDWMSWEDGKWGEKNFDPSRFPDPGEMVDTLHRQDVHYMHSIWPHMDDTGENYREFMEEGLILPGSTNYDAFSPRGRELYWQQLNRGLYRYGVDAWWSDNCEPVTPEWSCVHRPLPGKLFEMYQEQSARHFDATMTNAYGLYHNMGIFRGQRAMADGKRVMELTRSVYTGSQRHGTVLWSGDTAATWDTLRRQVAVGPGFCASGHPYWTMDIGAFFVKDGNTWFWKGDYDDTTQDLGYRELFVRWHQWGAFLPLFRGHGTDCDRELWHFGEPGTPFYDALVAAIRLRYELMPYIYSLAGSTWLEDGSMIRSLAFRYPRDPVARRITDQYLFGDAIMVCPVTRPMYYEAGSRPIPDPDTTRRVYLPRGRWYDFYTHRALEGGGWITVDAPLERIPLFVRAGSILPRTDFAPATARLSKKLYLDVFTGADGEFLYYEDAGDGWGYEAGEYTAVKLRYRDAERALEPCALLQREDVTVRYI